MFGRFKNKNLEEEIANSRVGKMFDYLALAAAVSKVVREYFETQKNIPISKAEGSSVMEVWIGTRLEAISQLWNFGAANVELVVDPTKHPKLLDAIIARRPFLPDREPTADEIKDTISAICKVYDYLDQLEHDLAVPAHSLLKHGPGSISRYASFVLTMEKLHPKWQAFTFALTSKVSLPEQPETIFVLLWRDITFRAKMIALCSQLGPSYMAQIAALRKLVHEANEKSTSSDNLFVKILSADDPDKIQV
jgi:hypothetical protein